MLKAVGAGSTSQAVPKTAGPITFSKEPAAVSVGLWKIYIATPFQTETSLVCGLDAPSMGARCTQAYTEQTREISPDHRITK
jgi:hypothetical protein